MENAVASISGLAAVEKALTLLDLILEDDGRRPISEQGEVIGLPRSTLYRLASTLESAGFINKLGAGRYVAGINLLQRVESVTACGQLVRIARPLLTRLAHECSATAHLGILENDMVTYLVKESAPKALPIFTRENSQLEAYCSGIGKIMLAWLPKPQRERYLTNIPFVPLTSRTVTSPDGLRRCLRSVRTARLARDEGEVAEDIYCLAVPVFGRNNIAIAGLSLSFRRSTEWRHKEDMYVARLRSCSESLTARICGS